MTEDINKFIEWARKNSDNKTGNILGISVGIWLRYRHFLEIIKSRYKQLNSEYLRRVESELEKAKTSPETTHKLTPQEMVEFEETRKIGLNLHLEIESFYIFSKILLDRSADTFSFYFRYKWAKKERGKVFGSTYSKMNKGFSKIASERLLLGDDEDFQSLRSYLQKNVIDYRTEQIEHISEPRLIHGTAWGADKKTKISPNIIYPRDIAEVEFYNKQTKDLDELFTKIDAYLVRLVDFFMANLDKSVLK